MLRPLRAIALVVLGVFAVAAVPAYAALAQAKPAQAKAAQQKAADAPSRQQLLTAAREIMIATRYGTMVTNGPGGTPQARIVDAFGPDTSLTVWIATNAQTRKVAELKKDPRVTLLYFSPVNFEYVTIQGRATFSTDAKDRETHWKRDWSALYQNEWRGSDYLLIKVKPSRVEVVSTRRGINTDPVTWRPASVELP
ncbi:MAG: pyridoxamine 5'-phosphate oxidase family protein [Gemmatimonadota bacterium]|nr:pyridoxamine 5'-phosphate oxidase family protein [Gemmatimonadota bacterium]